MDVILLSITIENLQISKSVLIIYDELHASCIMRDEERFISRSFYATLLQIPNSVMTHLMLLQKEAVSKNSKDSPHITKGGIRQ